MTLAALLHRVVGQPQSYERKTHYEFGPTLGAGAFGVVRRAKNRDTGEDVAVKVILRSKLKTAEDERAVMSEFEILRGLHHPNIVALREWFESKDKFYMVMQLCTGGELFDRILDYGSFTEREAARSIREVAEAVQYLHHRNIVHRDIKPENLLFEYDTPVGAESESPLVLCDFGVAKSLMSSEDVILSAAGSLGYAAPEVFLAKGHSKPVDVWSLGVVLYTVLSGHSPFQADTPQEFMDEVQPGFKPYFFPEFWDPVSDPAKDLVTRMLQYEAADRPTIDEVLAHPWLANAGIPTADYSLIDLLPKLAPSLRARKVWRAAYEKVQLSRMLKHLQMDAEGDEDANMHSNASTQSSDNLGSRFRQVVAAAAAQAEVDKATEEEAADNTASTQ